MSDNTKASSIFLPYEDKWVALNKGQTKVVASGSSIRMVEKKLNKQKDKDVIITYVLPFQKYYSPNAK